MSKRLLAALMALALTQVAFTNGGRSIVINGEALTPQTIRALESAYNTSIPQGYYWYDRYSGLWGRAGGPAVGQIQAGLQIGGRLHENASNGTTGVVVNGRRLQSGELIGLQNLVGYVRPGRYWLDAYGNAGFEGGPALVNVVAAARHQRSNGNGGWNRNTPGGNWGGDGNCSYYSHPDGPSVMIGDC